MVAIIISGSRRQGVARGAGPEVSGDRDGERKTRQLHHNMATADGWTDNQH